MLDPHLLRYNLNEVVKKLARRKFRLDEKYIKEQEKKRRILQIKTENLQFERNSYSKKISTDKFLGKDTTQLCQKVNEINKQLRITKSELTTLQKTIHEYISLLPNIPSDEVPEGTNSDDDKKVYYWNKPRHYDFPVRDHVELGETLGGIDFSTAVKMSGSRFVIMYGHIARLYRALSQFMLDTHIKQHGYMECYLPYLVNYSSLYGSGQLPKFFDDLFHIQTFNKKTKETFYALIPTAEVPLTNLMKGKIIEEHELPIKVVSNTPCFRSEVGSYGKENRGLIRTHQFDKVELVQIVKPEDSKQALENITRHAEEILRLLDLPYRKVLLCTGNIGFAASKTYDLEVWLPAKNIYKEISSCSNTGDFQSRRMKIRFRDHENKKLRLVHILNGSGLAVGRTLAAILENYQLSNGSITIPKILRSYMGGLTYI